jgi:peptidoglycan/LPS O-acetylase OafA/YrhL
MGLPNVWYQFKLGNNGGVFYALGAAMMIYGCVQSKALGGFFSLRPMRFLGRVSFSLYLVHLPLLLTVFATIYLKWRPQNAVSLLAMFLLYVIASLLLATGATLAVDEPVLRGIAFFKSAVRLTGSTERIGAFLSNLGGTSTRPENAKPVCPSEPIQ